MTTQEANEKLAGDLKTVGREAEEFSRWIRCAEVSRPASVRPFIR